LNRITPPYGGVTSGLLLSLIDEFPPSGLYARSGQET